MTAMSPGTYLRKRREAAGLSVDDVAAMLACDPHYPEHERRDHLKLLEADAQPASALTIASLRSAFQFDGGVLDRLSDLFYFNDGLPEPRLCRECGCSQFDPCIADQSGPCAWAAEDLCTACEPPAAARTPSPTVTASSTGEAR